MKIKSSPSYTFGFAGFEVRVDPDPTGQVLWSGTIHIPSFPGLPPEEEPDIFLEWVAAERAEEEILMGINGS